MRENRYSHSFIQFDLLTDDQLYYQEFENAVKELLPSRLNFELKKLEFKIDDNDNKGTIIYAVDEHDIQGIKYKGITKHMEEIGSIQHLFDFIKAQVTLAIKYIALTLFENKIEILSDDVLFKYKVKRKNQNAFY